MRNHLIAELEKLAQEDNRICLFTGDLGYGVLDHFAETYPERYYNAGISEQNMMLVACGMAMEGNIAFTYSIGNFSGIRCVEQIRNDICYHNANVKIIVVGGGFAYGQLGMSHHATEDIGIMRALPNMHVFCPSDAAEAIEVLYAAYEIEGPCYIRLGKGKEPLLHDIGIKKDVLCAEEVCVGKDIALMSTGSVLQEAINAAAYYKARGIQIAVYNFAAIKPIDEAAIRMAARKYKHLISIEEHNVVSGFGGAVAEVIAAMPDSRAQLTKLGLQDEYTTVVGSQSYLRKRYGIDEEAIRQTIDQIIAKSDPGAGL